MSGPAFFQTRMGARFYDVTMPAVADELKRLNRKTEALVAELRESNRHATEAPRGGATSTIAPGKAPAREPGKAYTTAAEAASAEPPASWPGEGLEIASEATEAASGEVPPSTSWDGLVIAPEAVETAPGVSDND
jgi:hypothetical protein